jgi:hypothetical protein
VFSFALESACQSAKIKVRGNEAVILVPNLKTTAEATDAHYSLLNAFSRLQVDYRVNLSIPATISPIEGGLRQLFPRERRPKSWGEGQIDVYEIYPFATYIVPEHKRVFLRAVWSCYPEWVYLADDLKKNLNNLLDIEYREPPDERLLHCCWRFVEALKGYNGVHQFLTFASIIECYAVRPKSSAATITAARSLMAFAEKYFTNQVDVDLPLLKNRLEDMKVQSISRSFREHVVEVCAKQNSSGDLSELFGSEGRAARIAAEIYSLRCLYSHEVAPWENSHGKQKNAKVYVRLSTAASRGSTRSTRNTSP